MQYARDELDTLATEEIRFINKTILGKGTWKLKPRHPFWTLEVSVDGKTTTLIVHGLTEDGFNRDYRVSI